MKKLISLENLIYLTIFLLPGYLIKISLFSLPTNLLEVLIAISFIWVIFLRGTPKIFLKGILKMDIIAIIIGIIVSMVANKNYEVGLGIIKSWFIFPILLAIISRNAVPKEKRKNIYMFFYFSATALSIISLGYYFSGQVTFDGRLQSIFNSPNYLAMYLAPALIIGLAFIQEIKQKNSWHVFCCAASYATIIAAFYLTYSYATWVSILVSMLVMGIFKNKGELTLKTIFIVMAMALLAILSQWNNQKFKAAWEMAERSSLQSRSMIWRAAGKIAADNPVLGIGPGNFQNKYLEYQKYFPPYLEWAVPHPHNVWMAFWLYGGLLGLFGFITLVILWFREIMRKEKDTIWFASCGIMLYFLLHGLIDTTYFKNDLAAIFWINFWILL